MVGGRIGRRTFSASLGGALVSWPFAAASQRRAGAYRIGFLALGIGPGTRIAAEFRDGLRELGYIEGDNAAIDYRFAQGQAEKLTALAAELAAANVDVIVTESTPAALAAKRATATIPIVMAVGSDPVAAGLVADLARPGGNITGLTNMPSQLMGKRLELVQQTAPMARQVGILWNPLNLSAQGYLRETVAAANALGLRLAVAEARNPADLDAAFAKLVEERAEALVNLPDGMIWNNRARIAEFALARRIPGVFDAREFAEAGGLLVYGPSLVAMFRRSAAFVDKVLKGADPAALPIELPTRFELIVNLKTAKALGLTVPEAIVLRADEVIE